MQGEGGGKPHQRVMAVFLGVGGIFPPCPALWIMKVQAVVRKDACIEDGCILSSPETPPAGGLSTLVKQNHTILQTPIKETKRLRAGDTMMSSTIELHVIYASLDKVVMIKYIVFAVIYSI